LPLVFSQLDGAADGEATLGETPGPEAVAAFATVAAIAPPAASASVASSATVVLRPRREGGSGRGLDPFM